MRQPKTLYMENLRQRLRDEVLVRVVETTPEYGGARERDLDQLVQEGFAEWVVPGEMARLRQGAP
jgi:hypothetical protein